MNITKILTLFLFLTICLLSFGQSKYDSTRISGLIRLFANNLGNDTVIDLSTEDGKIIKPEHYNILPQFISRGKDYEFFELTKHNNVVIRCYAFEALYYTGSAKIIEALQTHFTDTVEVWTRRGCVRAPYKAIEIMMDVAKGGRIIDLNKYPEKTTTKMSEDDYGRLTKVFEQYYGIKTK